MSWLAKAKEWFCGTKADKVCELIPAVAALQLKLESKTYPVYRYKPAETPGLRNRWWGADAGPHVDPLEWDGPADSASGFPLPTDTTPTHTGVSNSTNIRDNPDADAGFAARYGIIDGWIFLPDDVTHLRDNNANTGELGMVLLGGCCGGPLEEQPGGNHTASTNGSDRTLMDSTPISAGWHYIYNPQSDSGAFQGLDLEFSTDNEASWQEVTVMRPTIPVVECQDVPFCDPVPEGWQDKFIQECCQPTWTTGGEGLDEEAVQALLPVACDVLPVPDNELDTAIRTGQAGTSDEYARCDHNHPIRRQANPGDPVLTVSGSMVELQSLILDRWSTEESYEYEFRIRFRQVAGNDWGWINVPAIAGFQQPQILSVGNYRNPSTVIQEDEPGGNGGDGASPRGPFMGQELHHWSSTRRVYSGYFRRDNDITSSFAKFIVRYIRT